MTPKQLQRLALGLPEAHEQPHFDRTSFRVGSKIFATMTRDGAEAMVRVPSPERVHTLLTTQPKIFFSYGGWTTRGGALGVHLAQIGAVQMRELVTDSWRHVAPKKVLAASDVRTASKPVASARARRQ